MSKAQKIRVLVVEDSAAVRELLEYAINHDPRLEVVASVGSAEEALKFIDRNSPDVISMDIHLPGMNGMDATRRIMRDWPTPIVVVSTGPRTSDAQFTMEALKAGALSVVEKPTGVSHEKYTLMAERLCTQLAAMSQIRVVKQRFPARDKPPKKVPAVPPSQPDDVSLQNTPKCIGLVASTGGPKAISRILSDLGPGFPLPILLVQHMSPTFLETFIVWLGQTTPFNTRLACDGETPVPGTVYHSPPDRHLSLQGGRLYLSEKPELTSAHRPSGNVLLASMAADLGHRALGVVFTGMGSDGAEGLLAIRNAGGHTITEDKATAIVFGMPDAANKLGAAKERLPLDEIAPRLLHIAIGTEAIAS